MKAAYIQLLALTIVAECAAQISTNRGGATLARHLQQVQVPIIEFRQANVREVLDLLVRASFSSNTAVSGMVASYPTEDRETSSSQDLDQTTVTLSLTNVSLFEAILTVADRAGLSVAFEQDYLLFETPDRKFKIFGREQARGENGEPAPAFGGPPKTTLPAEPAGELVSP